MSFSASHNKSAPCWKSFFKQPPPLYMLFVRSIQIALDLRCDDLQITHLSAVIFVQSQTLVQVPTQTGADMYVLHECACDSSVSASSAKRPQ